MKLDIKKTDGVTVGIDVGSTTAKLAVIRDGVVVRETYERHFSRIRETIISMLEGARNLLGDEKFTAAVSGSAGMGLAEAAKIPFVQEVWATGEVVKADSPDTSLVIELGGEDAKIIFFDGAIDERMNGTCAGGTGAFIDQMATLLDVTPDEMDALAMEHKKIYPIASRCGVFAKSDVQPLLNQGAAKSDVAASIYQAVVNQTIAGLAQGRKIAGKVMFLGGPLYFNKALRERFVETLKLTPENAVFPDYARNAVSIGAAIYAASIGGGEGVERYTIDELIELIKSAKITATSTRMPPLFKDQAEYDEFAARHAKAAVEICDIAEYSGDAYLGIDCGSTTTKLVLIGKDSQILYTYYDSNKGNPVEIVRSELDKIYNLCENRIKICGSAVTGYGEELITHAFRIDCGVVETIAHYTAAKFFKPEVDFILDIGGQDIKCFKIANGAIDKIMLNEACSSGCGSFIETFARGMHMNAAEFAKKALFAKSPVNLGSRCTVFMNSQVKQSQKDGATVEDISAGLSISVVKNAIYKVIRAHSPDELGRNIVVQGGTFANDAVLRAFEREIGGNVTRPNIAGLMGAYGAALYSMKNAKKSDNFSSIITKNELKSFTHTSKTATCNGCGNHCLLTINTFPGGKRFISGNKCEKGAGLAEKTVGVPNLYEFKRELLLSVCPECTKAEANSVKTDENIVGSDEKSGKKLSAVTKNKRGKIGLPLTLGMYELLPLWTGVFEALGFEVCHSGMSTKAIYEKGQFTIPSDTACYPAKIMHGHIEKLCESDCDAIFYPRLTWNLDERFDGKPSGDNHYNCPVVAYYSELLRGNMDCLKSKKFLYPYLSIDSEKELTDGMYKFLRENYVVRRADVKNAVKVGFEKQREYVMAVRAEGEKAIKYARDHELPIMILAGRPYHCDAEISHGIDKLALSLGFVVVSEDSVCHLGKTPEVHVLNQWTYHSRLYRAASFAAENPDVQLVQLVSFGCGVDAITTDEVRRILEAGGKYYTQIKIDEIANLGAVKIRLRSLKAVI